VAGASAFAPNCHSPHLQSKSKISGLNHPAEPRCLISRLSFSISSVCILRCRNTDVRNAKERRGGEDWVSDNTIEEDDGKLPPSVLPICLGVFVQMLGEGIAISSIPLHLKGFGASAVQVGLATSAFSVAQMVCCPLIVKLSSRIGRATVLRMCLAGATAASFVITLSPTINGVIFGRFLAGIFASAVPVAQAGVTDMVCCTCMHMCACVRVCVCGHAMCSCISASVPPRYTYARIQTHSKAENIIKVPRMPTRFVRICLHVRVYDVSDVCRTHTHKHTHTHTHTLSHLSLIVSF